jgi:hypothetical protein
MRYDSYDLSRPPLLSPIVNLAKSGVSRRSLGGIVCHFKCHGAATKEKSFSSNPIKRGIVQIT